MLRPLILDFSSLLHFFFWVFLPFFLKNGVNTFHALSGSHLRDFGHSNLIKSRCDSDMSCLSPSTLNPMNHVLQAFLDTTGTHLGLNFYPERKNQIKS